MSKTWLLTSFSADRELRPGQTDLVWQDGRPVEIEEPIEILSQRVRKTVMTPLGANRFNRNLGFEAKRLIGRKQLGDSNFKSLGLEVERMFGILITSQRETARRIKLEPGELIRGLARVSMIGERDTVTIRVNVITEEGVTEQITIPEAISGVP